jgi:hypothetical protein|tara:strand:- start:52 stop:1368 length:1317 start_codon:yes stop_codon:yes gene_type:complete
MAFEPSEGLYAGLSFVSTADLQASRNDVGKFKELYFVALENLKSDKVLDAAGNATKNGMIKIIDLDTSSKKPQDIYGDLAASISAVLGTRSKLRKDKVPSKVYLTGNKWHPDVEPFKVKAFGMADYNSSDVILKLNGNDFVGISLKKKPKVNSASPTLINNAFSAYIEGPKFASTRNKLNDHRIKFFAGVIKEACEPGGPLERFAVAGNKKISSMNPNNIADAKALWDMKVIRTKNDGKTQKIPLINLKSESELADRNGLVKNTGSDPSQLSFRDFVNKKLQSTGKLNPLYQGFLDIMNQDDVKENLADVLLTRVLKTGLMDTLDTWDKYEFGFYLTEGVGTVDKNLSPNVGSANVLDVHSIMIAMANLSKEETKMVLDKQKTLSKNAAKVFFILSKGKTPILEIELRYKGDFAAFPQFFAGITPEFKKMIKEGDTGI